MHTDLVDVVVEVDNYLVRLGKDMGLREAVEFLDQLADRHADQEMTVDAIGDASSAVGYACELSDEYMDRDKEVDGLSFDPTALLGALHDIVEQSKPHGHAAAVEVAREHRDDNPLPEDIDPDDEDEDPDEHARLTEYSNGALYAAQQLVAHFGVDPDPDWEPAE